MLEEIQLEVIQGGSVPLQDAAAHRWSTVAAQWCSEVGRGVRCCAGVDGPARVDKGGCPWHAETVLGIWPYWKEAAGF